MVIPKSPGFWKAAWRRFRQRKLAMAALLCVLFLAIVAIFSPAIAGTKPIVVKFQGHIYFPAIGYYRESGRIPTQARNAEAI
ncbi:MAG: hypothetical protein R3B91_13780 [Planctomycetaceae bacterium]